MAIDDRHEFDPHTGFAVEKDTGVPIGLMSVRPARVNHDDDFPKWITPHEDHVVRKDAPGAPEHVSIPGFSDIHVDRVTGAITVMVHNAEDEAALLAAKIAEAVAEDKVEADVKNES